MPGISIISTITRLNMDTWNLCRIGLIQLFIAGLNKAFTSWIGAVRPLGSWTSMIWILLLWNKDVESGRYIFGHEGTHSVPYIEQIIEPDGYCKKRSRALKFGYEFYNRGYLRFYFVVT